VTGFHAVPSSLLSDWAHLMVFPSIEISILIIIEFVELSIKINPTHEPKNSLTLFSSGGVDCETEGTSMLGAVCELLGKIF
jgi:hypothetical protein